MTYIRTRGDSQQGNRTARRRSHKHWKQAMQALVEEGGGLLGMNVVRLGGPRPNDLLLGLIYRWAYAIADSGNPVLCLGCDTKLFPDKERGPAGWLFLFPMRDEFEL